MPCTEESEHWNYDNPSEWPKYFSAASGLSQSPIDININESISQSYPPFVFSSKYYSDELFKLTNNGHQVAVTLADRTYGQSDKDLWFTGGGIEGTFFFVNFHLHWGRNDRHGSEHQINGYRFPAEAHVVFKNPVTGQLAVFAFLFTITNDPSGENLEWKKYTDVSSQLKNANDTMQCMFNLSRLMQVNERSFIRYMGSLTTPPCSEGVIWTIFTNTIPINEDSVNQLRQNLMRKVYRPVQPLNNRSIFRSY
ncbi:unnamed protein product [Adineta steineri]|uniref:Carbonic anhydrase n=2 Tax=Adineta steineri TaxID=433720 RepID=A0A819DHT3_9BILA|nr:unnamed protein product [Adineta steineri]CAF3835780.1 unnamed protein product [Adineta steineri]